MSQNCMHNLTPIQRKLLMKRKFRSTFNSFNGLNKNNRKRIYRKKLHHNTYLKPHQIECERLKEILPTVANCKNLDEVKIIQEAIKHINYLEQAVLQRLNIINDTDSSIVNNNLHSSSSSPSSSSSLLPAFLFKLLSNQNNPLQSEEKLLVRLDDSYQNNIELHNHYIINSNNNDNNNEHFLSKSYEHLNSNGSTPYWTDEDIY